MRGHFYTAKDTQLWLLYSSVTVIEVAELLKVDLLAGIVTSLAIFLPTRLF